jgi:hypothetical protein
MKTQAKPDWRAVAVYYTLACLWSWPLFWWRDKHGASWNALHLPTHGLAHACGIFP